MFFFFWTVLDFLIQIFRQQPHGYRRDRATANSILEKKMQCAGIHFMVYMCI